MCITKLNYGTFLMIRVYICVCKNNEIQSQNKLYKKVIIQKLKDYQKQTYSHTNDACSDSDYINGQNINKNI